MTQKINPVCIEIGKINIYRSMHAIPHNWYSNLKTDGGNTDIVAALILADTHYWYTPTEIFSEKTGKVIGQRQKFKRDKLQRSYKYFENLFGFTRIQIKRSIDRLVKRNLLTREFRTIEIGDIKMGNVMFIEPIAKNVALITDTILEDPSLLYSQEGTTTESRGHSSKVNIDTLTTTKTTTMRSKDRTKAIPKNRLKPIDKNLKTQNPLGKQNTPAVVDKSKIITQSQKLRDTPYIYKKTPKKEKVDYICPKVNKPFVDAWCSILGKKYRGFNTPTYRDDCIAIGKLRRGTFFDADSTSEVSADFYTYKVDDITEWCRILEIFKLMRLNSDYYPKSKTAIKKLTIKKFLYNTKTPNGEKSYFVACLTRGAKKLASAIQIKDVNPEYTEYIIEECAKRFGWDMSNGGREDAIRAGKRISQFFETNKDRIHLAEHHYAYVDQRVNTVLDALEKKERADYPVKPFFLHGDITFNNVLPEYLKRVGSMD